MKRFALAFLFLAGCGVDLQGPTPDSAGTASTWLRVVQDGICKPPEASCGTGLIEITRQGTFRTENNGGQLTPEELAQVNAAAQAVAAQDLTGEPSCDSAVAIPELDSEDLSLETDGSQGDVVVKAFDAQAGVLCIRGDRGKALQLAEAVRPLFRKYSVTPRGGPAAAEGG